MKKRAGLGQMVGKDRYVFSDAAAEEARWALECESRAGTAVGRRRAWQIANKKPVSMETVQRVKNFKRHQGHGLGPRDCSKKGRVAWGLWGGSPAILKEAPAVLARRSELPKTAGLRPNRLIRDIERQGRDIGDGFKRLSLPKRVMSEAELLEAGFKRSLVAVPERGQAAMTSFRHETGLHAHDHGERWVMHQDKHAPSGVIDTVKHVVTEGIPSLAYTALDPDKRSMVSRVPRWR